MYLSTKCSGQTIILINYPNRTIKRFDSVKLHSLYFVFLTEYDLLAKVIQQQPNRQETEKCVLCVYTLTAHKLTCRQIDNLQQKLKQLEATKKELHSKVSYIVQQRVIQY